MYKVTNNMWKQIECDDKMVQILTIIYTNDLYIMQAGDYKEAETKIAERGLALWEIFWGKMTPLEWLTVLADLLSQWEDNEQWNKVLDKLFWDHEKNK